MQFSVSQIGTKKRTNGDSAPRFTALESDVVRALDFNNMLDASTPEMCEKQHLVSVRTALPVTVCLWLG